jgi:hypothetical protein
MSIPDFEKRLSDEMVVPARVLTATYLFEKGKKTKLLSPERSTTRMRYNWLRRTRFASWSLPVVQRRFVTLPALIEGLPTAFENPAHLVAHLRVL